MKPSVNWALASGQDLVKSERAMLSRRMFLALLSASVSDMALANAPLQSLRPLRKPSDAERRALPAVQDLISRAKLGGKVSFGVADIETGEFLDIHRPLAAQPPASVAKAITTLYAFDRLGPGAQFRTELVAAGPVQNGRIDGDLVLVGGGDPTLNTDHLFAMATALKDAGIREIAGKFRVWGGALPREFEIDQLQPDHVGYNPAISGLNLNFNRVFFEWKKNGDGYAVTMDGRTERLRPEVGFARARIADRKTPIFSYALNDGRDDWTVARRALGKGGGRWLPTRQPEIYAGDVFRTVARSHGIDLPFPLQAEMAPTGEVLVAHTSPPLRSICRGMLRYSTNLTAEVVGMVASGSPASLRASADEMSHWLSVQGGGGRAKFVDHSGLGDASRISANAMVRALMHPGARDWLSDILKPVAIRDRDNRVVNRSPISAVAKTGTLNFVSSLAGYIRTPKGRDLAFAVFSADLGRREALSEAQRERPPGARSWNGRAKKLQGQLINRWATIADI